MANVYKCAKCDNNIRSNAHCIQCLLCHSWYHKGCSGLSNNEFDAICSKIKKNKHHDWTCTWCRESGTESVKLSQSDIDYTQINNQFIEISNKKDISIKDLVIMVTKMFGIIMEQRSTIEEVLTEIKHINVVRNIKVLELEKQVAALHSELNILKNTKPEGDNGLGSENSFEEIQDRINRANNVVMFNVPEKISDDSKVRINHDIEQVEEILHKLDLKEVKDFKVIRLGKLNQSKPRPIKVFMVNTSNAQECIKRKRMLKDTNIKISADLTTSQREYRKKLYTELNERKGQGENDIIIRYANGVPKIVKAKPRERKNM